MATAGDKPAEHRAGDAKDNRGGGGGENGAFATVEIPDAFEQPQERLVRRVVFAAGEPGLVLVVELPGDGHLEAFPFQAEICEMVRDFGSIRLKVFSECRKVGCQAVGSRHDEGDGDAAIVLEMLGDLLEIADHPIARLWRGDSRHAGIEKDHGGLGLSDHFADVVRIPIHPLAHVFAKYDFRLLPGGVEAKPQVEILRFVRRGRPESLLNGGLSDFEILARLVSVGGNCEGLRGRGVKADGKRCLARAGGADDSEVVSVGFAVVHGCQPFQFFSWTVCAASESRKQRETQTSVVCPRAFVSGLRFSASGPPFDSQSRMARCA